MLPSNGYITLRFTAVAFLFLLLKPAGAFCQNSILDSTYTFRSGIIKTGAALDLISRRTGFNFTYDSRLIDRERKTSLTFANTKLSTIIDSILRNDSLALSVIDKFIIVSRKAYGTETRADSSVRKLAEYVTGVILDEESLEPLPYATVAFRNRTKGTVTNNNGEFSLRITPDLIADTLAVAYLGYISKNITVKEALGTSCKILMRREFISIPEIIIKNQIPQEIISKARKAIAKNYGSTPAYLTAFYREGIMKRSELQTYSEAVLKIYKSSYSGTLLGDQIKVYKSRKIDNADSRDTLTVRLKAGLSTCLELDGVRNTFDFISPESLGDYSYRLTDIVTYDEETAYAIEFEQKPNVELPLYKGIIYINTVDYAILKAEFELHPSSLRKMKDSFVTSSARHFSTWPVSVKYSASYRKMGDRYFLNHVRGDLLFNSRERRQLFSTQFKVFFELAVTDLGLENVTRFDREEITPLHSIFSRTISSYDPQFWGSQDFLRPEDDLIKALKNMNVKLQEFSK